MPKKPESKKQLVGAKATKDFVYDPSWVPRPVFERQTIKLDGGKLMLTGIDEVEVGINVTDPNGETSLLLSPRGMGSDPAPYKVRIKRLIAFILRNKVALIRGCKRADKEWRVFNAKIEEYKEKTAPKRKKKKKKGKK